MYYINTQTGIADASNIIVTLRVVPTVIVAYNVTVGQVPYTGTITVLMTDVNGATVYSGSDQAHSMSVLTTVLPV